MRIAGWPPPPSEDENLIEGLDFQRCYEVAWDEWWDRHENAIIRRFQGACYRYKAEQDALRKEQARLAQLERERTCPGHAWALCVDFGEIKVNCDVCGMDLFRNEDPAYAILQGWDAVEALGGSVPISIEIEHSTSAGMFGDPREEETYVNIGWVPYRFEKGMIA